MVASATYIQFVFRVQRGYVSDNWWKQVFFFFLFLFYFIYFIFLNFHTPSIVVFLSLFFFQPPSLDFLVDAYLSVYVGGT